MTLAYLKKTPRSGNLPTWMVIGNLMKEPKAEWKTLAREFKAKDLVAALAEIAKDPQANGSPSMAARRTCRPWPRRSRTTPT